MRAQAERVLSAMDVVQREEFEAVREMAIKAREENLVLTARIEALEARLAAAGGPSDAADPPEAPRRPTRGRSKD